MALARALVLNSCFVSRCRDYLEVCKPKVVALIVFTAIVGMALAVPGWPPLQQFVAGLVTEGVVDQLEAVQVEEQQGQALAVDESLLEGRADLAIAGSSDCLTAAGRLFPDRPLGEGAAFFLLATNPT